MMEILQDHFWKSFAEKYPRENCGVLLKIKDPRGEYADNCYEFENRLYYARVSGKRVFILADLTSGSGLFFKVSKVCDDADMYWYYDESFDQNPPKTSPEEEELLKRICEYGKYIPIQEVPDIPSVPERKE